MKPVPPKKTPRVARIEQPVSIPPETWVAGSDFEAVYQSTAKTYWFKTSKKDWCPVDRDLLKIFMRDSGISANKTKEEVLSEVEAKLMTIADSHRVAYAGPLAGHSAGLRRYDATEGLLVTKSPDLIEPKEGEWPLISTVVQNMLGEEQSLYFYGWLKFTFECLYSGNLRPGQCLAIAGPPKCGKSLLQSLLTECLGRRDAQPYRFMVAKTDFNKELFECIHQKIEDEVASTDTRARKNLGQLLKQFTSASSHKCHGKCVDGVILSPFWRLTMTLNSEPEDLMVLPILDDGLVDKIHLLKAEKHPMPMTTKRPADQTAFWNALVAELPAMIHGLLEWQMPEELEDDRFGVRAYQHPELLEGLSELAPEMKLLEMIDGFLFADGDDEWQGTCSALETRLENTVGGRQCQKLFTNTSVCGAYLTRLQAKFPERFVYGRRHAERVWTITKGGVK